MAKKRTYEEWLAQVKCTAYAELAVFLASC